MAEQDRKDLVPSVLNDLIDVDGDATEGDGLTFTDDAWRPGPAPGLLPKFGPAVTYWEGTHSGSMADGAAANAAWEAMTMVADTPGGQPALGEWGTLNNKTWRATEPGFYTAYAYVSVNLSGLPAAGASLTMSVPLSAIDGWHWGMDSFPTLLASTTGCRADYLVQPISQGMIDAGWGGWDFLQPNYDTSGGERMNGFDFLLIVTRHSPGSTVEYYGDL